MLWAYMILLHLRNIYSHLENSPLCKFSSIQSLIQRQKLTFLLYFFDVVKCLIVCYLLMLKRFYANSILIK